MNKINNSQILKDMIYLKIIYQKKMKNSLILKDMIYLKIIYLKKMNYFKIGINNFLNKKVIA